MAHKKTNTDEKNQHTDRKYVTENMSQMRKYVTDEKICHRCKNMSHKRKYVT
jgi:hypothetical protein